ncbi:unnamed protein product [Spirodela intermedia]|uniref:Late embryogenesis abundant protein LEA-2 subgroup domain-containing protein n=1 Tax=Spirodela intermedia TaxID=51605 RepID=A0A7I8JKZ7_SPIIN|nr:unnamed protein product [Spirodela intermedia]CAA6670730.1 unnamed protein product [Spirodela intermedia]
MPPITTPQKHRKPNHSGDLLRSPANVQEDGVQFIPVARTPGLPAPEQLHHPRFPRQTPAKKADRKRPLILCCAALCFVFAVVLIVVGVVTLVVFLVIKPRNPGSTLPSFLNGDLTFLANFSNPNGKIDVQFEFVGVELYFRNTLIAAQALQPFAQRRGEVRLQSVHMISSEVFLSPERERELQDQVNGNRVVYTIKGTFKVRTSLGLIHITYWLYGLCTVELSRPRAEFLWPKLVEPSGD